MDIKFFAPLWGSEQMGFTAFLDRVVEAGYDGVELSFEPDNCAFMEDALNGIRSRNLQLVAQHWQTVNPDIDAHIEEFSTRLQLLASAQPVLINSQTGRDWFSLEDCQRIYQVAHETSASTGIKIVHETHRGRPLFSASVSRRILEADPSLRITADFSHWCCTSESLLEGQEDAVELAISRTDHIHARVGHPEGPQIFEPRAPEWQYAVDAHLAWWDAIVETKRAAGEALTITPEFGPHPYMPALPYTNQPLADQWDINVYMMNLLRERYGQL